MTKYYLLIALLIVLFLGCKKDDHDDETPPAPSFGTWQLKESSLVTKRMGHVGVSVNGKGYVGLGNQYGYTIYYMHDWWEYNPTMDKWTQKASYPGHSDGSEDAFATLTKAYVVDSAHIYCYNPSINSWTQLNDFPGVVRPGYFMIGTDDGAYMGLSLSDTAPYVPLHDWWKYTESTDQWEQKSDFNATGSTGPVGFVRNNKIYLSMGNYSLNNILYTDYDLWEYSILDDEWKIVSRCPENGDAKFSFALNGKGYFAGGISLTEYDLTSNTWKSYYDYKFSSGATFVINNKVYLFQGYTKAIIDPTSIDEKFWELTP